MRESKKVVVDLDGNVVNVGELSQLEDGWSIAQREMEYTVEYGWREVSFVPPISEIDKLKEELVTVQGALDFIIMNY